MLEQSTLLNLKTYLLKRRYRDRRRFPIKEVLREGRCRHTLTVLPRTTLHTHGRLRLGPPGSIDAMPLKRETEDPPALRA